MSPLCTAKNHCDFIYYNNQKEISSVSCSSNHTKSRTKIISGNSKSGQEAIKPKIPKSKKERPQLGNQGLLVKKADLIEEVGAANSGSNLNQALNLSAPDSKT